MADINDSRSTIYELAMIGLMYGEDIHLLNNKLGAAYQHLNKVIEFADGLDKESKEKLIRVRKLLKELLEFQKEKSGFTKLPLMEKFDLRETVSKSLQNISIPVNIVVEQRFKSENAIIDGYQKQTGQIFRVLFHNAIEAMEGSGRLTILMADSAIDNSIEVTVTDSGTNNPTESRQIKKGWGMGLAWASAYLQTCGGKLSYDTEQGKESTFKVTLPKIFNSMRF